MTDADPLRYFRIEAQELVDALERHLLGYGGAEAELAELFRLAHTLKGSARVVRQGTLAELAHALEDVLAHHRELATPLDAREVGELLALVDALRGALTDLPPAPGTRAALSSRAPALDAGAASGGSDAVTPAAALSPTPGGDAGVGRSAVAAPRELDWEFVRVGLDDMDSLAAGVLEVRAQAEALREQVNALTDSTRHLRELSRHEASDALTDLATSLTQQHQRLTSIANRVEVELRRLSEQTSTLRLLDAKAVFPELERAVHDAARATGKGAHFSALGGAVKVDAHVLSPLRAALLHLVRNAVAHGIEPADVRTAAQKPALGAVEVRVERRGARIAFLVGDDGGGVDRAAVQAAARRLGVAAASAQDPDALIFHPGLSTAEQVSDLAGRGVGLDAVRSAVTKVKGHLRMSSQAGRGTTFEIVVPVSLSSIRALVVRVAERTLLVPADAVVATWLLRREHFADTERGQNVVHEGHTAPFRDLARRLASGKASGKARGERETAPRIALLLRVASGQIAIGVESLVGTRDVTVRPLPRSMGSSRLLAGVAFDSQGDPELVLDPEGLIELPSLALLDPHAPTAPRRVLVIDDSLTTRMLEQSILEGAGYDVDVACSAEEGLERAQATSYGLLIVDVEMPGMNGYEFTAEARRRPETRETPIIMVTSLASEESRRRGREAGIDAYIVKGEFEQGRFLDTVAELLP